MPTDEELYSRYLQGKVEALDELILRHQDGLTRFIFGIVKNEDDAKDLMMETFALLLAKKPKFSNISSFRTWLYGIGRYVAIQFIRKNKRIQTVSYVSEEEKNMLMDEFLLAINDNDILTDYVKKEEYHMLYDAIDSLKEEYRTALYLKFFSQMEVEQIAKAMKKSPKQVYNLLSRAKEQLKNIMGEKDT